MLHVKQPCIANQMEVLGAPAWFCWTVLLCSHVYICNITLCVQVQTTLQLRMSCYHNDICIHHIRPLSIVIPTYLDDLTKPTAIHSYSIPPSHAVLSSWFHYCNNISITVHVHASIQHAIS